MPRIHPSAVVSTDARLADDVIVGPFAVIEGAVELGAGSVVGPHAHLIGPLTTGAGNRFHTGCVIGDSPQHLGYQGEPTRTQIGDANIFREYVTVHRGMPTTAKPGTGATTIGSHNLFMVSSHVAHDCRVGNHCIFANSAVIGGHAEVLDRAILSGNSAVHQFCRVGRLAFLSGTSAVSQDLPPFFVVQLVNVPHGVNVVGMRRAGISHAEIQAVRHAYRVLNKSGLMVSEAVERIEAEYGSLPAVQELVAFIRSAKRGIVTGRGNVDEE
jgi:UDP-N-acetylglucosamine acyltransferase